MNRYERQVQRLLRAYPESWRRDRGEEMVGTLLDLSDAGERRVPLRTAADILVGGWRERARRHVMTTGLPAAGWRFATSIAIVAQLVVSTVWLRDWGLTGTPAILPHLVGPNPFDGINSLVYGMMLAAFIVGALAWLSGWRRVARTAGATAIFAWLLNAAVLVPFSNPAWYDLLDLTVWGFLLLLATAGLFQSPPTHRGPVLVSVLALVLAGQALSSGVSPQSATGTFTHEPRLPLGILDRGADTLHTALRTGWTLLAIASLAATRVDPRPVIAACWLFPMVALNHVFWGGPLALALGLVASSAVLLSGLAISGRGEPQPDRGPGA